MKAIITISLDSEIIRLLKGEKNYSDIINEEMKAYYDIKKVENLEILNQKLAEIKQNMKISRKKRRDIEETINKITKKKKLFLRKMLSRGKMIKEIQRKRDLENQNPHKRITYYTTVEEEADRLLKGGGGNA